MKTLRTITRLNRDNGESVLVLFPGIQEYVEAVSFHHFIRHRTLISLEEINARLVFMRENKVR